MAIELKYFVLKPKSRTRDDPYAAASRLAMWVYAQSIELVNPQLAIDLKDWCNQESEAASQMDDPSKLEEI